MHSMKIFNTSTIEGLKSAERFKARLNERFERVEVVTIGLDRVQIIGHKSKPQNCDCWMRVQRGHDSLCLLRR